MNQLVILPLLLATACATNGPSVAADPPLAEPAIAEAQAPPEVAAPEQVDDDPAAPVSRAEASTLVRGHTAFATDLYRWLAAQGEGNLFLSPASVSAALAMTRAGARGTTAAEMDATLHFELGQDRLHGVQASLDESLRSGDAWQLAIANRLWGQTGLPFEQPFLETTRFHYGAELAAVDFGATEPTRQQINAWVSDSTNERIPELLAPGVIDPATTLVLTNAIWFQGSWATTFEAERTAELPFTMADGKQAKVPLMHQEHQHRWGQLEGLSLLALPYEGDRLEMLLALPDAHDGLPTLEASVSPETLDAWDAALRPMKVQVWLPRFELSSDFELSAALAELGMPSAFGGDADFSGITQAEALAISKVIHQAWVAVDEQGTEAAAATAVVTKRSIPRTATFRADRPFLFLIRDTQTGAMLFMGRYVAPPQ